EHEFNKWQVRELILTGKVDVINADAIKAGGITECKKMAAMAEAFDKPIMVHNTRPTLGSAACLQLVASLNNAGRFQEYGGPREYMNLQPYFDNHIEYADGFLKVPQAPGLGLIVNEKKMEALRK
ncbi:MAG: enolase C-terminal domain-like protein, partial [Bacteroidota bacterium]